MASSEGGTFELMLMRKAGARFEAEFPARLARNRDRSGSPCLLLSGADSKPTRTLQGMARARSGQAPAWPLSSVRSAH